MYSKPPAWGGFAFEERAMKKAGIICILFVVIVGGAGLILSCGGGGGGDGQPSSNWDEMVWDQDNWA